MDIKLIDVIRCPTIIMLDAVLAKRINLSSIISFKPYPISMLFSLIGTAVSTLMFLCEKKWLLNFYRTVIGAVLLYTSFVLQALILNTSGKLGFIESMFPQAINGYLYETLQIPWWQRVIVVSVFQSIVYEIFMWNHFYGRDIPRFYKLLGHFCTLFTLAVVTFTEKSFLQIILVYFTLSPQFSKQYIALANFFQASKNYFFDGIKQLKIHFEEHGLPNLIEHAWVHFRIPNVLRVFFFYRVLIITVLLHSKIPISHHVDEKDVPIGMYYYFSSFVEKQAPVKIPPPVQNRTASFDLISPFMSYLLKSPVNETTPSCLPGNLTCEAGLAPKSMNFFGEMAAKLTDSIMSIFAIGSAISVPLHYAGYVVHAMIGGGDVDQATQLSIISATLFCLLSIQTGLSGMPALQRIIRLNRNGWLQCVAFLHFIQDLVKPVLLQLSSQVNIPLKKHFQPLSVLLSLFIFPIAISYYNLTYPDNNKHWLTWIIALVAFCIELVIKAMSTFLLYLVHALDARTDKPPFNCDDANFKIRSVANCLEFACGVVMFVNGAYVFLFESGNWLRAIMMALHAYHNIYKAALDGIKVLKSRRTVQQRIEKLKLVTSEEIEEEYSDDVCSICFQEFDSTLGEVRQTNCNHVYHSICIKKWLLVRENCPMCHAVI